MDFNYLADLLFPNVTMTRDELEAKYPLRELPEGAAKRILCLKHQAPRDSYTSVTLFRV